MNTEVINAKERLRQAAGQLNMAVAALDREYWNDAVQYAEAASKKAADTLVDLRSIAKYLR